MNFIKTITHNDKPFIINNAILGIVFFIVTIQPKMSTMKHLNCKFLQSVELLFTIENPI